MKLLKKKKKKADFSKSNVTMSAVMLDESAKNNFPKKVCFAFKPCENGENIQEVNQTLFT